MQIECIAFSSYNCNTTLFGIVGLSRHHKIILASWIPGRYLQLLHKLHRAKAIQISELKLIYVPIPKAANRSIKTALAEKTNKQITISAHRANWDFLPLDKVASSSYYSFSIVRNPLDRLLSCYIQKTKYKNVQNVFWKYGNLVYPEMSFKEFVDFVCQTPDSLSDRHFKSQHTFLYLDGKQIVDQVGKLEEIEEEWNKLSTRFNLPALPHINQSGSNKRFAAYYTKEIAQKVCGRYAKDIEFLGYQKEVNDRLRLLE